MFLSFCSHLHPPSSNWFVLAMPASLCVFHFKVFTALGGRRKLSWYELEEMWTLQWDLTPFLSSYKVNISAKKIMPSFYSILNYSHHVVHCTPWHMYPVTGNLFLFLTALMHFPMTLTPASGCHQSVPCIDEFIFVVVVVLDSTRKWDNEVFVSVWLFNSIMTSRSTYAVRNGFQNFIFIIA